MKIVDILHKEMIMDNLKARDKKGVLEELLDPIHHVDKELNKHELVKVLLERERLGSTGIGGGIGIPHGKSSKIQSMIIGFGLSRKGVDFESIDGKPTHIFFLLLTPENSAGLHLKFLARIAKMLQVQDFKEKIMNATNRDEIYAIIQEEENDLIDI
ncbi:MAG: PTS sugar transporter subunit IIA [Desulfobacterales bacterium]|nr:PTS sugar transporter subunit IIA [Desulfobacterales bacterium]